VRFFNPFGLPLAKDGAVATHPGLRKLRDLVARCQGMLWSSPERHGAMTGLRKAVCNNEGIRTGRNVAIMTQGRRLAPCPLTPLSTKLSAAHI
jgi:arsenic resistance protein ArsH